MASGPTDLQKCVKAREEFGDLLRKILNWPPVMFQVAFPQPQHGIRKHLDRILSAGASTALIAVIVTLAISAFWVLPLRSSLWLDETGTAWAVRGSLRETVQRAFDPGQPSILFSVISWVAASIGGLRESTLRMPSLIASFFAAIGVYLLTRRLCDRYQSLIGCGVFATHASVVFAAVDARPYALGLMATVWAFLLLGRWCETGRVYYGASCAIFIAGSIYIHYLCATMLPLYGLYILFHKPFLPRRRDLLSSAFLLGALLLILLPHVLHLWRLREEHSFLGTPTTQDMVEALLYYRLTSAIVVGAIVVRWLWPELSLRRETCFSRIHVLLCIWYVGPILLLFGISLFSHAKLFVPRYYVWGLPGLAVLTASVLSSVRPLAASRALGLIVLLIMCMRPFPSGPAAHGNEDWRGALRAARSTVLRSNYTLLLLSGFSEKPLDVPSQRSMTDEPLLAPLAMYPVPGNAIAVSSRMENVDRHQWETIISRLLLNHEGFVLVARKGGSSFHTWLLGRMSGERYCRSSLGDFAGLTATVFEPLGAYEK